MADRRARVTAVYPSGELLPENTLRFYLHFSVPMAPGRVAELVHLRDEAGRADRAAFMAFKQELWNENRTRLTLLIDPGRIKRSIARDRGLDPALREGHRHSLAIDAGWPTADGSSTLPAFSKAFRVGPALRERPDEGQWTWRAPRAGTSEPLVVAFDRPFDRHLLIDSVEVVDSGGAAVDGTPVVGCNETAWSFVPAAPWPTDALSVRVADRLEDVAGNNLRALLERDLAALARHGVSA